MGKVLLIALIALALVFWLRHKVTQRGRNGETKAAPPASAATSEKMVMCTHCGVHLPAHEAFAGASGKPYCDAAHRALARDDPA